MHAKKSFEPFAPKMKIFNKKSLQHRKQNSNDKTNQSIQLFVCVEVKYLPQSTEDLCFDSDLSHIQIMCTYSISNRMFIQNL